MGGMTCKYQACELCDGCGVCGDFHGNFVGRCDDEDCPYGVWRRVRDAIRRLIVKVRP